MLQTKKELMIERMAEQYTHNYTHSHCYVTHSNNKDAAIAISNHSILGIFAYVSFFAYAHISHSAAAMDNKTKLPQIALSSLLFSIKQYQVIKTEQDVDCTLFQR